MKSIVLVLMSLVVSQTAFAADIIKFKDWSGEMKFIDSVGQKGCVAETKLVDGNDTFRLQVIRMETAVGQYTRPVVVALYESSDDIPVFYEASGKSSGASRVFNMPLFQNSTDSNMVSSRMADTNKIVERLRWDNTYTLQFKVKNDVVKEVDFSLAGSDRTIGKVFETCR